MIAPFVGDWTEPSEMAADHSDVDFVSRFHDRDFRRNKSASVRSAGSGTGTGRRLSHRICLDEVRSFFSRRIRCHDHRLGRARHAFSRRLASAHSIVARAVSLGPHRRLAAGWRGIVGGLFNIAIFFAKVIAVLLFFIWVRWTLPRFRYDQLMRLGWVFFFEIALVNIFIVALIIAYFPTS